ncbi:MAG: zf-HC2 domain-containing protein [Deltaproteobacteria bacterium]|nr:zf-HC2 domain-containing protein [Deltaproteobacteria bacterium]
MTCEDIRKYAFVYLDEEFAVEEKVEFESHIRGCEGCRDFVVGELEVKTMVRGLEQEMKPPASLKGRILRKIEKERQRSGFFQGFPLPVYAAAASVFAVAIFSVYYFNGGEEDIVDSIVADHETSANSEILGDSAEVGKFLKQRIGQEAVFPLKEDANVKLLGAKLVNHNGTAGVRYMYLVNGKKVSVMRYPRDAKLSGKNRVWVNPKSRFIYLDKTKGFSVATFEDGNFSNSIVSDMPEYELVNLVW